MCSKLVFSMVLVLTCCSCAVKRQMTQVLTGELKADIAIPQVETSVLSYEDSSDDTVLTTSAVMNAMKDSITGEMVATDVLRASKVVARFRHAAERGGMIRIEFDLCVPSGMVVSKWKLGFYPKLSMNQDSCDLAPVFVTGEEYRGRQLRGYERYKKFIDSIITDDAAFIRQENLEIFIRRHFPLTYRMKTDSSFVTACHEENLFGVTVTEAVEHYKKHLLIRRNQKKINDKDKVFRTLVKDPIDRDNVRLDTVLTTLDGDFIYRYQQVMAYRPMLKKIILDTDVRLFEDGEVVARLQNPQSLTYYISSLNSLVDKRLKYRSLHDSLTVDTLYMRGVELVENADYKAALKILRPYNDYNTALALLLSGYDEAALTCLNNLRSVTDVSQSGIDGRDDHSVTDVSQSGTDGRVDRSVTDVNQFGTDGRDDHSVTDGGQVGLSANVYYLMAVVYSRLGDNSNAIRAYQTSVKANPALMHRANLDPEVYELIHNVNKTKF